MSDLKLNLNNDLEINKGRLVLIDTEQELTSQKIAIALRTYQGEWFLDVSEGIPYFQTIFKKNTPKSLIDSLFYKKIEDYESITEIISFESSINNGVYSLLFKAKVQSGEIITVQQNIET